MTTGIVYGTRTFDRDCKLTIAYDESTRLVTDQELTNEFDCKLVRAEISNVFGFRSPNAAHVHLRALKQKGAISIKEGLSRGIQIQDQALVLIEGQHHQAL
jgi:SOS-response transcriptional repressor LexA